MQFRTLLHMLLFKDNNVSVTFADMKLSVQSPGKQPLQPPFQAAVVTLLLRQKFSYEITTGGIKEVH